jgi:hypothetical protein
MATKAITKTCPSNDMFPPSPRLPSFLVVNAKTGAILNHLNDSGLSARLAATQAAHSSHHRSSCTLRFRGLAPDGKYGSKRVTEIGIILTSLLMTLSAW